MNRTLTLLIVLYLTFVGGTAYAHTGALPDSIRYAVMTVPMIVWITGLIRARRTLPPTPLDQPLAVYAIWLVVAALVALDRRISLEMIWPLLAHVSGFYLLVDLMRRGWADHFRLALLAVAVVIVLISAVEFAAWYAGWLGLGGLIPPVIAPLDSALNISTIQGNTVAVLIPLVITGALANRNRWARGGLAGLALVLLAVEVLTLSRGGLLGTFAGIGLLIVFGLLRWDRRIGLIAAVLAAVAGAALMVLVWTGGTSREASDRGRVDIWRSAWEMASDHPLVGVGPGIFGLALRSYRDPDLAQDKIVSAHNLFLNTLAETGVIGLLIALWLIAAFGRAWWRAWRRTLARVWWASEAEAADRQRWLEGGLAALVAYGVHSLVDTFPLTSSMLPLLIIAAYTIGEPPRRDITERMPLTRRQVAPLWIALAGIALYGVLIVRWDIAQGWMTLSRDRITHDDLDAALTYAHRAQTWDADLSLYDLHEAYVLGLLAEDDPDTYLDRAIRAHESALAQQPTFDTGWANLAALYTQRGDFESAHEALTRAAAINPNNAVYWFKLKNYPRALEENPGLATYALAAGTVDELLDDDSLPAGERLYLAVLAVSPRAPELIPAATAEGGWLAFLALGMVEHRETGDYRAALDWLTLAIHENPSDERPWLERAAVYFALGDLDAAEQDARTALFVDPYGGAWGNAILAEIERQRGAGEAAVTRLWENRIRPRPVFQYVAGTIYARPAAFDTLPQLDAPEIPPFIPQR